MICWWICHSFSNRCLEPLIFKNLCISYVRMRFSQNLIFWNYFKNHVVVDGCLSHCWLIVHGISCFSAPIFASIFRWIWDGFWTKDGTRLLAVDPPLKQLFRDLFRTSILGCILDAFGLPFGPLWLPLWVLPFAPLWSKKTTSNYSTGEPHTIFLNSRIFGRFDLPRLAEALEFRIARFDLPWASWAPFGPPGLNLRPLGLSCSIWASRAPFGLLGFHLGLLGSIWASWVPFGPPGFHLGQNAFDR